MLQRKKYDDQIKEAERTRQSNEMKIEELTKKNQELQSRLADLSKEQAKAISDGKQRLLVSEFYC